MDYSATTVDRLPLQLPQRQPVWGAFCALYSCGASSGSSSLSRCVRTQPLCGVEARTTFRHCHSPRPSRAGFNVPSAATEYAAASQEAAHRQGVRAGSVYHGSNDSCADARERQYHAPPAPAHPSPLSESPPSTLSLSLGPPTLRASNLRLRVPPRSLDPSEEDGLLSPKRHDVIQRKLLASEGHNFFSVASAA